MLPHLSFKPTSMESSIPVPHRELYEHTIASTAFWICAAVFFLLCPVLMTKPGITALCVERIRQRRWNVTVENARDWHQEATSQLEERSNHRRRNGEPVALSMEEQEEFRQLFLIQQLSQYTKTIASHDMKLRNDTEKNIAVIANDSSESAEGETDVETGKAPQGTESLECNNGSEADVDHEFVEEYEQSDRFVTVIAAGESVLPLDGTHEKRDVSDGCAICLCDFHSQDQVTWSANKVCPHVFHSECVLKWMMALGRKAQNRRRQYPEHQLSTGDPLKDAISFPMHCPCCRQQFVNTTDIVPSLTPAQTSETSTTEETPPRTTSSNEAQTAPNMVEGAQRQT